MGGQRQSLLVTKPSTHFTGGRVGSGTEKRVQNIRYFILNGKISQNRLVSKINVLYIILRKAVNLSENNINYPCRLFKFCGS